MRKFYQVAKRKFMNESPVWVAKVQILLGAAAGSLGSIAAISWPGKSAVIGEVCGYGAAGCAGTGFAINFLERAVKIIETPSTAGQAPDANLQAA